MNKLYTLFGQAYGEGTYSTSTYNGQADTTGATSTNGGTLVDTGFGVLIAATLASLIAFSAIIVRIWKRPATSAATSQKF